MPTIQIFEDGYDGHRRWVGGCQDCGRKLLWCRTARGKAIPFDENPDPIATDHRLETVSTEYLHMRTCAARQRPAERGPE